MATTLKSKKSVNKSKFNTKYILYFTVALLLALNAFLWRKTQNALQRADEAKYVYVYNSDALVQNYREFVDLKQKYEQDLVALTGQVNEVKAKLDKMKDKKSKAEVSEAYLESLVEKRNNLVNAYQQNLFILTNKVNDALAKVSTEKDIPTILEVKILAVKTPYVIDLTEDILKKLQ